MIYSAFNDLLSSALHRVEKLLFLKMHYKITDQIICVRKFNKKSSHNFNILLQSVTILEGG